MDRNNVEILLKTLESEADQFKRWAPLSNTLMKTVLDTKDGTREGELIDEVGSLLRSASALIDEAAQKVRVLLEHHPEGVEHGHGT